MEKSQVAWIVELVPFQVVSSHWLQVLELTYPIIHLPSNRTNHLYLCRNHHWNTLDFNHLRWSFFINFLLVRIGLNYFFFLTWEELLSESIELFFIFSNDFFTKFFLHPIVESFDSPMNEKVVFIDWIR